MKTFKFDGKVCRLATDFNGAMVIIIGGMEHVGGIYADHYVDRDKKKWTVREIIAAVS
jgi:uncharacterized membrane protein